MFSMLRLLLLVLVLGTAAVGAGPIAGSLEARDVREVLEERGYRGVRAERGAEVRKCAAAIEKYGYQGFCRRYLVAREAARMGAPTAAAASRFRHPKPRRKKNVVRSKPPVRLSRFGEAVLEEACGNVVGGKARAAVMGIGGIMAGERGEEVKMLEL